MEVEYNDTDGREWLTEGKIEKWWDEKNGDENERVLVVLK